MNFKKILPWFFVVIGFLLTLAGQSTYLSDYLVRQRGLCLTGGNGLIQTTGLTNCYIIIDRLLTKSGIVILIITATVLLLLRLIKQKNMVILKDQNNYSSGENTDRDYAHPLNRKIQLSSFVGSLIVLANFGYIISLFLAIMEAPSSARENVGWVGFSFVLFVLPVNIFFVIFSLFRYLRRSLKAPSRMVFAMCIFSAILFLFLVKFF